MGVPAATEPPASLRPGTVLDGRYRLEGVLGEGGVGWVFRASHLQLHSEVAIKVLQTTFAQKSMMGARFVREARAMAALKHPNIVTVTDFSVSGEHPYIVMELLEGLTVREEMNVKPFEPERARRVIARVLDGLAYAHGKGFVHRDLKPDNLFLLKLDSDDAFPKILDFGFVKLTTEEAPAPSDVLTRSGIAFGTPAYMSPEQATGAPADRRSDLYSLGIVFFEMLAGQRPYQGSLPEIVRKHITEPAPTFGELGASGQETEALRMFLLRALAKDASERFDNAAEMKKALLALPTPLLREGPSPLWSDATPASSSAPTVAAVPTSSRMKREPRSKRWRWLAGLIAILGIAGAALFVARPGLFGPERTEEETASGAQDALPTEAPAQGPEEQVEPEVADDGPDEVEVAAQQEEAENAMAVVDLAEEAVPEAETAESQDIEATTAVETVAGETTAVETIADPWESSAPSWILRARARVRRGRTFGSRTEDALRRYARSHRDDPRPHLLLGQNYRERGWDKSALDRFELAYRVHPTAAGDPELQRVLVQMSARSSRTERAAGLVRTLLGPSAQAAVDAELEHSDYSAEERARLEALRSSL